MAAIMATLRRPMALRWLRTVQACQVAHTPSPRLMSTSASDPLTQSPDESIDSLINDFMKQSKEEMKKKKKNQNEPKKTIQQRNQKYSAQESLKHIQNYIGKGDVDVKRLNKYPLGKVVTYTLMPASPPESRYECLQILLTLEQDLEEMELLLRGILKDMATLPIKVVNDIIQALSRAKKTPLRTEIMKELLLDVVNRRFYEVSASQVTTLMYQLDGLFDMKKICMESRLQTKNARNATLNSLETSKTTTPLECVVQNINLESRILTVSEQIDIKDLSRIFNILGKWRNRNEPLLNAILHRMSRDEFSSFSYTQIANILYACNTLKIHNEMVFRQVCSALEGKDPPNPAVAMSLVGSLAFLRWRDVVVLHSTLDYLADKLSSISPRDAGYLATSLALLHPLQLFDRHAQFVAELHSKASTPVDQINMTYSLAVQGLLTASVAESVLNPDFVSHFLSSVNPTEIQAVHRLLAINMAARLELEAYTGPLCDADTLAAMKETQALQSDRALTSSLIKAVSKFALPATYTKKPDDLPLGVSCTMVMCANSNGEVRPLSSLDGPEGSEVFYKLAISVIPHSSVIFPDSIPVGTQQFNARLLHKCGYVPVQITFSDLRQNLSPAEHVNNVKQRISAAVSAHVASHS